MNEISNNFTLKPDDVLMGLINKSSSLIKKILLKAIKKIEINEREGVLLFKAKDQQDKKAIFATANFLCRLKKGSKVSYCQST